MQQPFRVFFVTLSLLSLALAGVCEAKSEKHSSCRLPGLDGSFIVKAVGSPDGETELDLLGHRGNQWVTFTRFRALAA
jgi:hypothetical protein